MCLKFTERENDKKSVLDNLRSKPELIITFFILISLGVIVCYILVIGLSSPTEHQSVNEENIQIKSGMSAAEIGNLLKEKGLIRSVLLFRLTSALNGTSKSLKAGEYSLNKGMGLFQILNKLSSGEVVLHKFTIPEGFTLSQIGELWEEKGFGVSTDFIKASQEPSIREKYDVNSESLEGYLFPDTYMFPVGISESEAISKMLDEFKSVAKTLYSDHDLEKEFSLHEVISLASIIEREALLESEKPIISAVFHNRLKLGKRLESCATVLYGLGYPKRKLTYSDLRDKSSPYNTYVYYGLPPGPICNPGLGSITAALNPSEHKYLYFVSKNDGSHYFTDNYKDFLNMKKKYKEI
jgi:UPF0755 protein